MDRAFCKGCGRSGRQGLTVNEAIGIKKESLHEALRKLNLYLDDFEAWVALSSKVKELTEKGVINMGIIKQETLLGIIMLETMTAKQIQNIWKPDVEKNEP